MEKLTVLLELTRRCNLKCKHCYNFSSPDSKIALTFEEIKKVISDLKSLESRYAFERIILTGGEFITMDNAKVILNLFKQNFNSIIRIETNGFLFCKDKNLFIEFNPDEFFISIDKFHGSLKNDGTAPVLETFLENVSDKKIIVRITIERGQEPLKDKFLKKYSHFKNLTIEVKYVSPSGRAGKNLNNFQGYLFGENKNLFKCLAKNYIHLNTSKKWFGCYTACSMSYVANLGDKNFLDKLSSIRNSRDFKQIRKKGLISLLDKNSRAVFMNKRFYYRCEPCLYLQNSKNKKIVVIDLPAVDTVQDVYIKGFIFPTFSEKYLCSLLTQENLEVEYHNLNKENLNEIISKINDQKTPIYIHLTANKYYAYSVFKDKIDPNIPLLIGGPLSKFENSLFDREVLILDDLEENGIFKYFNIKPSKSTWQSRDYLPNGNCKNLYENSSITNDFNNVVLFGRGCCFNCKFCIHSCFHKRVYLRDIKSIKNELDGYAGKSPSIFVADAMVGVDKIYRDILKLMSHYKNIKFSMNIRADQITNKNLKLLKRINIDKLYIGVESTNNETLKYYNKNEGLGTILNALQTLQIENINYHLSFILNDDFDEKAIATIKEKFKASSYSFHYYIPYPGTFGYNPEDKWFLDKHWPSNIIKKYPKAFKLKYIIENEFNYPSNDYHTITSHNHIETFKIIDKKLNELENLRDFN